jgi:uncharacterized protein
VSERIKVPCIKVCAKDRASGWCLGCGRTGPEIARWWNVSAAERAAVLAELPRRLAAMGLAGNDRDAGLRRAREQSLAAAAAILGAPPAAESP